MRISDWSSDVCSSDLLSSLRGWRSQVCCCSPGSCASTPRCHELLKPDWTRGCQQLGCCCCGRIRHDFIPRRPHRDPRRRRSEEHTSELQSLMRISYAVFCLKKKKIHKTHIIN